MTEKLVNRGQLYGCQCPSNTVVRACMSLPKMKRAHESAGGGTFCCCCFVPPPVLDVPPTVQTQFANAKQRGSALHACIGREAGGREGAKEPRLEILAGISPALAHCPTPTHRCRRRLNNRIDPEVSPRRAERFAGRQGKRRCERGGAPR